MHHKRKGPKSTRAGCLMCKPHKRQGARLADRDRVPVRRAGQGLDEQLREAGVSGRRRPAPGGALLAVVAVAAACVLAPAAAPVAPAVAAEPTTRIVIPRLPAPNVASPNAFSDRYRPAGPLGRDDYGRDRTRRLEPILPRIAGGCRGVTRNAQAGSPDCVARDDGGAPAPTPGGEPSGCARLGETLICP